MRGKSDRAVSNHVTSMRGKGEFHMAKFRVSVNGSNLLLRIDGVLGRYGFYTTRYVDGQTENEASKKAIDLVLRELTSMTLNHPPDEPTIEVEGIEELESFGDEQVPGAGFSLYKEEFI